MKTETAEVKSPPQSPPAPVKVRKFGPPDTLAAEFGVQVQSDDRIQGIVPTDKVRDLLDAFGLQDRTELVFPFQHIKKQHGEIWRMRIEAGKHHSIDGRPVYGHQWLYELQFPEKVQGAQ